MQAFETLVSELLSNEGYWVRKSFKVVLTKAEKRSIGRPSSPRWELDVIAYSGAQNEILAIECKSFLDSPGVKFADLDIEFEEASKSRYKLFTEPTTRDVVLKCLARQLTEDGYCPSDAKVRLAMAVGKFASFIDKEKNARSIRAERLGAF